MTRRVAVTLAAPANDMVQEEIIKQVAFLSVDLRNAAFSRFRRHARMRSPHRAGRCADSANTGAREARAGELAAARAKGRLQQSRCGAFRRRSAAARTSRRAFSGAGPGGARRHRAAAVPVLRSNVRGTRRDVASRAAVDADADSGARTGEVRLLPLVSAERHVRLASRAQRPDHRQLPHASRGSRNAR